MLALVVMKRQNPLRRLLWVCLISRNGAVANKLHSVKPVLGDWQSSCRQCRKDETDLCRGRIGHTHLTHKETSSTKCEHCRCVRTVRHILVECNHFAETRENIFGGTNVLKTFRFRPTLSTVERMRFLFKI